MGLQSVANEYQICVVVVNNMRPGKREHIHQTDGVDATNNQQHPYGQPAKPEPLFGEDLFQAVTSRVMLERDQHSTEDNCIRARLIKGSIANNFTAHPTAHFLITEKGISNII